MIPARERIIVALDTASLGNVRRLLKELEGIVHFYKIGFELFTAHGWKAVELVCKSGAKVFLDLKLHDIPHTVAQTAKVLCREEVAMFNVHCLGGLEMMKAARRALEECCGKRKRKPVLLGVTVLTSHSGDDLKEVGIRGRVNEEVRTLARLAETAGLGGVVCSPREISLLRRLLPPSMILVTPGIRPESSARDDQKRIMTPAQALAAGADYLVIGRPITESEAPAKVAKATFLSINS